MGAYEGCSDRRVCRRCVVAVKPIIAGERRRTRLFNAQRRHGLERAGFRVVAASDERDAVKRAVYDRPGLILLEMGRVPPQEVAAAGRRMRARAGLPQEVPVVVYGWGTDETVGEGDEVDLGRSQYVVLPEDSDQMVRFLRGLAA